MSVEHYNANMVTMLILSVEYYTGNIVTIQILSRTLRGYSTFNVVEETINVIKVKVYFFLYLYFSLIFY